MRAQLLYDHMNSQHPRPVRYQQEISGTEKMDVSQGETAHNGPFAVESSCSNEEFSVGGEDIVTIALSDIDTYAVGNVVSCSNAIEN
jgi:hypothetical protein